MKSSIRRRIIGMLTAICGLLVVSCIPQREIVLLQNATEGGDNLKPSESITERYVLQPNDYIFVNVVAPESTLSDYFNPMTAGKSGGGSTMRKEFFYYGLDDSSCIDFPLVGKIDLKGCTVKDAKARIAEKISSFLKVYTLTVRLATNNFAILGEVARQGDYTMDRDQVTLFDAIAQAGGFTSYAKRREVKLLRKNATGELEVHEINMTQADFINTDYYYVYPNDIIYVRPLWHKKFGWGETFSVGLISSILSLCILVVTLTNK